MVIQIGYNKIKEVYLGNIKIKEVFLGNNKIFGPNSIINHATLNNNLVACYSFEGDTKNRIDGKIAISNAGNFQQGKIGLGINYGTRTQYSIINSLFSTESIDFSIGFWVNTTSINNKEKVIFDTRDAQTGLGLFLSIGGGTMSPTKFRFFVNNGISNNCFSTSDINLNTWEYYVVIRSRNILKIYKNGVLETNYTLIGASYFPSGSVRSIGNINFPNDKNQFSLLGKTDELCFWTRALTNEEILDLYNKGEGFYYSK